ncbi:hypothetical protein A2U01_0061151, partial [Trifolium medium]|nr:hypothetical protein [Trifolium medium]
MDGVPDWPKLEHRQLLTTDDV